jgi:hypothetical protein
MIDYITLKQNISAVLADLGFTLDKIIPLALVVIIIYLIINRKIKPIEKIEAFIIRLCGAIETGGDLTKIDLYTKESPLKINAEGIKAIEKIGFKKAIDDNLELIFKVIDKLGPKSALDVESLCIGIIHYLISDKEIKVFKEVEDFLYNNPKYNNSEYFKVAGLYLRDKYLERNPNLLPPEESNSTDVNG